MSASPPSPPSPDAVPRTDPLRVRLVAAPALMRAGLTTLLSHHADRISLLDPTDVTSPDVEIFEPHHVDDATPRVALTHDAPLVAITWDDGSQVVARASALGAVRVLPMSIGADELISAVEAACQGWAARGAGSRPGLLTGREAEIIARICQGMTNDEIAADLYLSINSIKTYIRSAYRKVGVTRRSQAVLWGLEHGY